MYYKRSILFTIFIIFFIVIKLQAQYKTGINIYNSNHNHSYYTVNGLQGVKDNSGSIVVPCKYEEISLKSPHMSSRFLYYLCYNNKKPAALYSATGHLLIEFDKNVYLANILSLTYHDPYISTSSKNNKERKVSFYDTVGKLMFSTEGTWGLIKEEDRMGIYYEVHKGKKVLYYDSEGHLITETKDLFYKPDATIIRKTNNPLTHNQTAKDAIFPERIIFDENILSAKKESKQSNISASSESHVGKTWTITVPASSQKESTRSKYNTSIGNTVINIKKVHSNNDVKQTDNIPKTNIKRMNSNESKGYITKTLDIIQKAEKLANAGQAMEASRILSNYRKSNDNITAEEKRRIGIAMINIAPKITAQATTQNLFDFSSVIAAGCATQLEQEGRFLIAEAALLGDKQATTILQFINNSSQSGNNIQNFNQNPTNDNNLKLNRHKVRCSLCNGKGTIVTSKGTNYDMDSRHWCGECHKWVMQSHQHSTCPSCKGTGEIEKLF